MAISVGDAVLKITGDTKGLDQSLRNTQNKTNSAMQNMKKAILPVGLAFTAIGIAGLKMADSARKMNAQLGVTALNLGITTTEMRNLALATTNVTFPLKEVLSSFDLLARAGVKDTEVLKATATAFDTLGDAVGMTAGEVTVKMVPAMKTFGLSAEEVADKTDLMTNLVRNSTVSLDNFGAVIGYITPELVAMGLTLEDTVALMAIMEAKGMSGEVATRAFRTAITQATREGISLAEALGVTAEEMDDYASSLQGITGITQEYADVANEQFGIMDKLRQKWTELTLQYGTFLQPLEPILATMTALGPVMLLFSTVILPQLTFATAAHTVALIARNIAFAVMHPLLIAHIALIKAVTVAQWLWNAAMLANPIGIIIVAIGALIAMGLVLWSNWESISADIGRAWTAVGDVFRKVGTVITDTFQNALNKMLELWGLLKAFWQWLTTLFIIKQKKGATAVWGVDVTGKAVPKGSPRDISIRPGYVTPPSIPFQAGGIAMRPMLATIAERQPEAVIPLNKLEGMMGGKKVNIFVELDGRTIARAIGQPLVDEIRLRTGVRI